MRSSKKIIRILKNLSLFLILAITLLYGYACAPSQNVRVKNGKAFCKVDGVFTHQWYDYYERACSCMEGEFYSEAMADINEAIRQRDEDIRMAKTYGMHLADYFPHREKGLIYYLLGNYDAAKSELEHSVQYEKSDKALFYLDKIRKILMEREKISVSAPLITTDSPDEIWTKDDPVVISGTARDKQYVSEILVADKPFFMENASEQVDFEDKLTRSEGRHDIRIVAKNLLGGASEHNIILHVDRSGPVITVKDFDSNLGKIQGAIYDESGEMSLAVNGKKAAIPRGKEAVFSVSLEPGTKQISFLAEDRLGNRTEAFLNAELTAQYHSFPLLMAQHFPHIATDAQPPAAISQASQPEIRVNVSAPAIERPGLKETNLLYRTSEAERVSNPLYSHSIVFTEILSVQGQVSSKESIESVLINDTSVCMASGRTIFFNHSVRLREGENRITIRARDSSGRESVRELRIIRQIPEIFKPEYRCTFKARQFDFHSFEDAGEIADGRMFESFFLDNLTSGKRFQIRISGTENSGNEIKPARFLLMGYIYKTRLGIEIVAEVVDIETSETEYVDAYSELEHRSILKALADALSKKFHKAFPLIKGKITQENGEVFLADMEKAGIRMRWPIVVGTEREFIGNAFIAEKRKNGVCSIRLTSHNSNRPATGDWVVTE
ncbi:MAG: hypothetical protein BWK80_06945 [Desulfobacteraceae bacterium IS3]|nr:MAG: hypothetical protein BWK80_06945 [Desulfobacteraceae bacterium IS3]